MFRQDPFYCSIILVIELDAEDSAESASEDVDPKDPIFPYLAPGLVFLAPLVPPTVVRGPWPGLGAGAGGRGLGGRQGKGPGARVSGPEARV